MSKSEFAIKAFAQDIDKSITQTVYAQHGADIVGILTVTEWEQPGGWISRVYVQPEHRRNYIAEAMLKHTFELARAAGKDGLGLGVMKNNLSAQSLYRKLGFKPCYQSGEHIVMTKHVGEVIVECEISPEEIESLKQEFTRRYSK